MSYHKSNLGSFGQHLDADVNGYVPSSSTTPWELTYDHGSEDTHDESGELTEYGEWFESELFPEMRAAAIAATEAAEAGLSEWQDE